MTCEEWLETLEHLLLDCSSVVVEGYRWRYFIVRVCVSQVVLFRMGDFKVQDHTGHWLIYQDLLSSPYFLTVQSIKVCTLQLIYLYLNTN